jgi:hypothetical protein
MKLLQQIYARLQTLWCIHEWHRMPHHGAPGEPYFMRCRKCLRMADLDTYLTDKLNVHPKERP